jgi:hypothetical protein
MRGGNYADRNQTILPKSIPQNPILVLDASSFRWVLGGRKPSRSHPPDEKVTRMQGKVLRHRSPNRRGRLLTNGLRHHLIHPWPSPIFYVNEIGTGASNAIVRGQSREVIASKPRVSYPEIYPRIAKAYATGIDG